MRMHGHRADPEQSHVVPRQRRTHDGNVYESRRRGMPKVGAAQVEEVDYDQQQREPEVAAAPQVDKAEEEEVARDKVAPDVRGCRHVHAVLVVEVVAVAALEDEEDDPVDANDDVVHGERGMAVVSPSVP